MYKIFVDFFDTEEAQKAVVAFAEQLLNGTFDNQTSLKKITGFNYDQLG